MSTRGDDSSSIGTNDDLPNSEDEAQKQKVRESIETRKAMEQRAKIGQASTSKAASSNNHDQPKVKKVAQPVVELLPSIAKPPGHWRTEEEAKKEGGGEEVQYFTFNWNVVLEPEHIKQGTLVHSSLFKTNNFDIGMSVRTIYEACQNCQNGQKQEASWHLHLECQANWGTIAGINLSDKFEFGMARHSGNTFSFCQILDRMPIFQGKISLAHEPDLTSGSQLFRIQCRLPDSSYSDRIPGIPRTRSRSVGLYHDIYEHYFDLFRSGEFSDVTIQVGGDELKAHQHILSAASPELRRLFDEAPKDRPLQSIVVNDLHVRDFQIFLKCIYTGLVEGLREHYEMYVRLATRFRVPSLLRVLANFEKFVLLNNGIEPGEPLERKPEPIGNVYYDSHETERLCLEAELARGSQVEAWIIYLHNLGMGLCPKPRNKVNESNAADANGHADGNSTDSDAQASAQEKTNPIDKRKQMKYKKGQQRPPQLSAIDEARASVEREAARAAEEDAKKQQRVEVERVAPAPEPEQARAPPRAADPNAFVPVPSRRTNKLNKRQARKKR